MHRFVANFKAADVRLKLGILFTILEMNNIICNNSCRIGLSK